MFVPTLQLLNKAKDEGYSIGGFNVWNFESALAILEAAEESSSPLIFNIQDKILRLFPSGTLETVIHLLGKESRIPFALHLDHGMTFEICAHCIQQGYQSVMMDGGALPLKENITSTQRVVEYAHPYGVAVEGQVGEVGASWDKGKKSKLTDPLEAQEFVQRTKVDLLAISIGTESGFYEDKPSLDLDLAEEILRRTGIHLVLHGSSGLSKEAVGECRRAGITHLRFGTDLHQSFFDAIRRKREEVGDKGLQPHLLLPVTKEAIKEVVRKKIEQLGSTGKAY